jgi:hypothetical protein
MFRSIQSRSGDNRSASVATARASAPKSARFAADPLLDALRARLLELALEARGSIGETQPAEAEVRRAQSEALIAQVEILSEIEDERQKRTPEPYERLRETRAWEVGSGEQFDDDDVARMVRMASLKLGIRSRHHSEEEAIEASRGIKFEALPSIERRAAEIVLRRRRAARNKPMDPASRIANHVRREWVAKVRPVRRKKGGTSLFSGPRSVVPISSIVRTAVPILDKLAGKPIASGIPTSRDLRTMKSAGMAALFAIVQMEHGTSSLEAIYKTLRTLRLERGMPDNKLINRKKLCDKGFNYPRISGGQAYACSVEVRCNSASDIDGVSRSWLKGRNALGFR